MNRVLHQNNFHVKLQTPKPPVMNANFIHPTFVYWVCTGDLPPQCVASVAH